MGNMLRKQTKDILDDYEIELSKKKGQSQLVDEEVLENIVDHGNIGKSDVILEIGPGIGNLTVFLTENAGQVIAIERDERLAKILRERIGDSENLEVINGDFLEVELPEFDKVISNLPYSISSPVTFKLLKHKFDLGVLMYQKEFAQRLAASPGSTDYGRLTVNAYYKTRVELLDEIPSSAFVPQPKVDSQLVRLEPRAPPFEVKDEDLFSRVVRAAFQHRRQKLRNAFYHSFREIFPEVDFSKDKQREIIDDVLPEKFSNSRPAGLAPEQYGELANIFSEMDKENLHQVE